MKITDEMSYRMLSANTSRSQDSVYNLQQQISSGRKITRPSDDPGTFELINIMHNENSAIQQYARNTESLEHSLLLTDSVIQDITNSFHRASEITVMAGDGTKTASDLYGLGMEVNEILESLLNTANTSEGGRYIFSGLRTDTQPYTTIDANGNNLVDIGEITYQGDTGIKQVEVGKSIYIEGNIPGSDAGGNNALFETSTTNLFEDLITLRDTLLAGQNTTSTTILQDLTTDLDHIINIGSVVGSRLARLQVNSSILEQREINLASSLEKKESIDIAKAVTDLSRAQLAYEAALAATGKMLNQPTLMNFI